MKLLWVKSGTLFSRAIRWGLEEQSSHFAVEFNDKIVFHSDLMGVRVRGMREFLRTHAIVNSIEVKEPLEKEDEIFISLVDVYDAKPYDFGAIFYFSYRALLRKFFNVPLPRFNAWGSKSAFLCTEIAGVLPAWVTGLGEGVDLGMVSPDMLYALIMAHRSES